jgi:DNA-binding NarL/FixJ family response regulator
MGIKVITMDDHPVVLNGIKNMLMEYDQVDLLQACTNEHELWVALQNGLPDVLLLDVQMQGKQGDELATLISEKYPGIAILVLSNLNQAFHVRNMFMSGAKGYLLKTADPDRIIEAIETVYNGTQYLDPALKNSMLSDLIMDTRATEHAIPALTMREKEILELIAEEMTSQEIAKKLFISLSAVENHRLNLLFKLNVKNAVGLIKKAIQMGMIRT